jgi:hypothetical protein
MRELLPGTWEAENGVIKITHQDGTTELLQTCWVAVRQKIVQARKDEEREIAARIKQHLQEKREKAPENKGGRGK